MRLNEALSADTSNYSPVEGGGETHSLPSIPDYQPVFNNMIRCPLPYSGATADSLRQFYMGGHVPQWRILNSSSGT